MEDTQDQLKRKRREDILSCLLSLQMAFKCIKGAHPVPIALVDSIGDAMTYAIAELVELGCEVYNDAWSGEYRATYPVE